MGTLETVEVSTGTTSVLLGPWSDNFTAGARWSPDGHAIVFEMVHKTGPELEAELAGVTLSVLRLGPAGHRALRGITDPALFAATADWSPDGRWIVYAARVTARAEASDLFRVHPAGGTPERLTDLVGSGGYAADPTFMPDGRSIVFSGTRSSRDDEALLLQVGTDGTELALATGDVEVLGDHPRVR